MTFLELAGRFDDLVNAEPDLSADEAWKTLERLGAQAVDLLAELRLEVVNGYVPPTFNDMGDKLSTRQARRWGWWRSLVCALAYAFPSRVPGGLTLSAGTSIEHAPGVYSGKWPRERWRSFSRDFAAACRLLDEIHRTRQAEVTANSFAAARAFDERDAGEALTASQKSRLAAPPPKVGRRPAGYVEDAAIATMVNGQWKSQPRPPAFLHCEPIAALATKLKASIADHLPIESDQSTHHRADPELAGGFFAVRKVLKDLLTAVRNRYAETGNPSAQLVQDAALSPAQCAALTSLWKCLDRVQAWCDADSGEGPVAHFPDDLLAQFNSSVDVFLRAIQYGEGKSDADDLEALKRERHELVSDLVQHKQALRGITMELVEVTKGKGTTKQLKAEKQKGKGGRPPLTPKERKRRLEAIAEWDRAKQYMQMKVFVQDKDYSLRELNKWLNTNSKSKSRAE